MSDSNRRIDQTVEAARRAADQSDPAFDVTQAWIDIAQVAAVQQGALAKRVALVSSQVAANPDVQDAAVRQDINGLTAVSFICSVIPQRIKFCEFTVVKGCAAADAG